MSVAQLGKQVINMNPDDIKNGMFNLVNENCQLIEKDKTQHINATHCYQVSLMLSVTLQH